MLGLWWPSIHFHLDSILNSILESPIPTGCGLGHFNQGPAWSRQGHWWPLPELGKSSSWRTASIPSPLVPPCLMATSCFGATVDLQHVLVLLTTFLPLLGVQRVFQQTPSYYVSQSTQLLQPLALPVPLSWLLLVFCSPSPMLTLKQTILPHASTPVSPRAWYTDSSASAPPSSQR